MYQTPIVARGFNHQSLYRQPVSNLRQINEIVWNRNTEAQQMDVVIPPTVSSISNQQFVSRQSDIEKQIYSTLHDTVNQQVESKRDFKQVQSHPKNMPVTTATDNFSKRQSRNTTTTHSINQNRPLSRQSSLGAMPRTQNATSQASIPLPNSSSVDTMRDYIQRERRAHTMAPLTRILGPMPTPKANMFASTVAPSDARAMKSSDVNQEIPDTKFNHYPKAAVEMTDVADENNDDFNDDDDDAPIIVKVRYDAEAGVLPSQDAIRQAIDNQLREQSGQKMKNDPIVLNFFDRPIQPEIPQMPMRPQQQSFNRPGLPFSQQINRPFFRIPNSSQQRNLQLLQRQQQQQFLQQQELQQQQQNQFQQQLKQQQILQQQLKQQQQQQQQQEAREKQRQFLQQQLKRKQQQEEAREKQQQFLQQQELQQQQEQLKQRQQKQEAREKQQQLLLQKHKLQLQYFLQQQEQHKQQQLQQRYQQQRLQEEQQKQEQQQRYRQQLLQQQQEQIYQQQTYAQELQQLHLQQQQQEQIYQQQTYAQELQELHLRQQQQQNSSLPPMVPRPSRTLHPIRPISMYQPPTMFEPNNNIHPIQSFPLAPVPLKNPQHFQTISIPQLPNQNIGSTFARNPLPTGLDLYNNQSRNYTPGFFIPINLGRSTGQQSTSINNNDTFNAPQNILRRPHSAPSSTQMFRPSSALDVPELSKESLVTMLNQISGLHGRQFNIEYAPTTEPDGYPIPLKLGYAANEYSEPVVVDQLPNDIIQHVRSSNNPALQAMVPKLTIQTPTVLHHAARSEQQVQQSLSGSSDDSDRSSDMSSSQEETDTEESEISTLSIVPNNIQFIGPALPTSYVQ